MRIFDASSIIYAWDNYPASQFPGLWNWIAAQTSQKLLCIARVAFEEVKHKSPDCATWLSDAGIGKVNENNAIVTEALRIKNLLGIQNDQFHPKGVDENDVIIIATAKVEKLELISDESRQVKSPKTLDRLKIPAVCNLPGVGVACIDFVDLIKQSGVVF